MINREETDCFPANQNNTIEQAGKSEQQHKKNSETNSKTSYSPKSSKLSSWKLDVSCDELNLLSCG